MSIKPMGRMQSWLHFSVARWRGGRDGRAGIPHKEEAETFPHDLFELKNRGDQLLDHIAEGWANEDRALKGDYCRVVRELELSRAQLEALEAGKPAPPKPPASSVVEEAPVVTDPSGVTSSAHKVQMSPIVYRILIFAIFIGEFPLNAIAFRLFGEAELLTWVMTASLAVVLVSCAHGLGVFLSLRKAGDDERGWIRTMIILPIVTIVGVGIVREQYLEGALEGQEGLATLGPVLGTVVFALINMLIYIAAAMLSYLSHDPDEQHKKRVKKALEEERRERERREAQGRKVFDDEKGAHSKELARIEELREKISKLEAELQIAIAFREKRALAVRHLAMSQKDFYERLMAAYCGANVRAQSRQNEGAPPTVLRRLPEVSVPNVFLESDLDWDCKGRDPLSLGGPVSGTARGDSV